MANDQPTVLTEVTDGIADIRLNRPISPAVGLGLQRALGADIRIVAPDARLGALEINWGLAPDSDGTPLLPQLIGADRAMELCATGRIVTGREAAEIGMATRVADDPHAAAAAREQRLPAFAHG